MGDFNQKNMLENNIDNTYNIHFISFSYIIKKEVWNSDGHYVVCPASIYGFWLPLWYLQILFPPITTKWTMTLRKWAAMYVWGIAFDSFYDFSIGIWNCYDSVVFVFLHFSFFRMTNINLSSPWWLCLRVPVTYKAHFSTGKNK
jgi:hypothetical protein